MGFHVGKYTSSSHGGVWGVQHLLIQVGVQVFEPTETSCGHITGIKTFPIYSIYMAYGICAQNLLDFLWVLFSCNYIDQIYVLVPWSKLVDRKKIMPFFSLKKMPASIYLEPQWPLFLKVNPLKQGPKLQSKQGGPIWVPGRDRGWNNLAGPVAVGS